MLYEIAGTNIAAMQNVADGPGYGAMCCAIVSYEPSKYFDLKRVLDNIRNFFDK